MPELVAMVEPVVRKMRGNSLPRGFNFEQFLQILVESEALVELEITEKERISVLTAQIIVQIMNRCGMVTEPMLMV